MSHLVVALAAEARPIAAGLGLARAATGTSFPLWEGEGIDLAVSGVGAGRAAAAVAWLFERSGGEAHRAWLNAGIGGHRALEPGVVRLATRVTDGASGRAWYPPLVFEPPCPGAAVLTVERPEREYSEDAIYEMEAAGFCAAAARCATAELIQVVKVVSDGPRHPLTQVRPGRVAEWMAGAMPAIRGVLAATGTLARSVAARRRPAPRLEPWLARGRFTVTQRRELERLLDRLAVLDPQAAAAPERLAAASGAGAILAALRERLGAAPSEGPR